MPISLKVNWPSIRNRFIAARGGAMIAQLETIMLREMDKTRRYAIDNRMAHDPGPPSELLHQRTGTLVNSMFADTKSTSSQVTGVLGAGVGYAAVHEKGGTFAMPAHRQLRTSAWGKPTRPYAVEISAHSATFPQRAFLRPSLEARRQEILMSLAGVVKEFMT